MPLPDILYCIFNRISKILDTFFIQDVMIVTL